MESDKAALPVAGENPTEVVESAAEPSAAGPEKAVAARSGSRPVGFRRAKAVAAPAAAGNIESSPADVAVPQVDGRPDPGAAEQPTPTEAQEAPRTPGRLRVGARLRAVAERMNRSPAAREAGDDTDPSGTATAGRRRRRFLPAVIVAAAVAAGVPVLLVQGSGAGSTRQTSAAPLPVGPAEPGLGEELAALPSPGESAATPTSTGDATGSTLSAPHAGIGTTTGSGSGSDTGSDTGSGTGPTRSPSRSKSPSPTRGTGSDTSPAPKSPSPTAAATVRAGLDYDAITGLGCKRDTSTQDYYTGGSGLSGWRTGTSGGFGGYGCSGKYESMPLNGTNSHSDKRYMVWWFATSKVSRANCDLWIYVPKAADAADTSGTAYFAVLPDKDSGATIGTFTVNQSSARGTWASSGRRWPMRDGKLAVKLLDRGSGRASAAAALVKCYEA